jgi:hypothetical protein
MSLLASCSVSKLRNCCRIESPSSWGSLTTIHYVRLYTHLCSLSKNLTLFLPQSANLDETLPLPVLYASLLRGQLQTRTSRVEKCLETSKSSWSPSGSRYLRGCYSSSNLVATHLQQQLLDLHRIHQPQALAESILEYLIYIRCVHIYIYIHISIYIYWLLCIYIYIWLFIWLYI